MANLKEIDVDKFVAKARELADEHGWCEVVDDALVELGLVENNTYSGTVSLTVDVKNIRVPAGKDANEWFKDLVKTDAFAQLEFYNPEYELIEEYKPAIEVNLVKGDAAPAVTSAVGPNWKYATAEGRVRHYFNNPNARNYQVSACGTWSGWGGLRDTSPRGENRNCAECSNKTATARQ